jgi:Janus/Ocnus family (Ocnus)
MPTTRRSFKEQEQHSEEFTTNEEDQREAAALQARLALAPHSAGHALSRTPGGEEHGHKRRLPSVEMAAGTHKYVLLYGVPPPLSDTPPASIPDVDETNERNGQYIVVSRRGAAYHRNVADPFTALMEQAGYTYIQIRGGGRITLGMHVCIRAEGV